MNRKDAEVFIAKNFDYYVFELCSLCHHETSKIRTKKGYKCEECKTIEPIVLYQNHYICPNDKTDWFDTWNCACNDHCSTCDNEIEPTDSREIFTTDKFYPA